MTGLLALVSSGLSTTQNPTDARNPQTSPNELAQLAQDQSDLVRQAVAKHPRVPVRVLTRLARDQDFWLRLAVAENPQTPVEGVNRLAQEASLRSVILEGLSKRSVEALCELAEQASPALAQIMVAYHKEHPLPLQLTLPALK